MIEAPTPGWLASFVSDFQHRFINLLAFQFRIFPSRLALALLDRDLVMKNAAEEKKSEQIYKLTNRETLMKPLTSQEIYFFLNQDDISRLSSYSHNLVDYHMIMDIVPELARLFFMRRFGEMNLSALQQILLIGQGLQHKTIDDLMVEFPEVQSSQMLSFFNRTIKRIQKYMEVSDGSLYKLQDILNKDYEAEERATQKFENLMTQKMKPVSESLDKVRR